MRRSDYRYLQCEMRSIKQMTMKQHIYLDGEGFSSTELDSIRAEARRKRRNDGKEGGEYAHLVD